MWKLQLGKANRATVRPATAEEAAKAAQLGSPIELDEARHQEVLGRYIARELFSGDSKHLPYEEELPPLMDYLVKGGSPQLEIPLPREVLQSARMEGAARAWKLSDGIYVQVRIPGTAAESWYQLATPPTLQIQDLFDTDPKQGELMVRVNVAPERVAVTVGAPDPAPVQTLTTINWG